MSHEAAYRKSTKKLSHWRVKWYKRLKNITSERVLTKREMKTGKKIERNGKKKKEKNVNDVREEAQIEKEKTLSCIQSMKRTCTHSRAHTDTAYSNWDFKAARKAKSELS